MHGTWSRGVRTVYSEGNVNPVDDVEAWSTDVLPVRMEGSVTPVDLSERLFLLLNSLIVVSSLNRLNQFNLARLGSSFSSWIGLIPFSSIRSITFLCLQSLFGSPN